MGLFMLNVEKSSKMSSQLQNILEPGEPKILIDKDEAIGKTEYFCFTILDLFRDLFWGRPSESPLLDNVNLSKDKIDLMAFLIPAHVLKTIEEWKDAKGNPYIISAGSNNDYKGFFEYSINSNKIISVLHQIFAQSEQCLFIEEIRNHIISNLQTADITSKERLVHYLSEVGSNVIVPYKESPDANAAFNALLESKDDSSLSIIIANFLVSSLLGIRSMRYSIGKKTYKKTYLLNSLGMVYIWNPSLITAGYEKLHDLQKMYLRGEYRTVYREVGHWIKQNKTSSRKSELSLAYQIYGSCLVNHPRECVSSTQEASGEKELNARRANGAKYLEKSISYCEELPESHYTLFEYYQKINDQRFIEHLKAAFAQNYAKAVREVANACIKGDDLYTIADEEQLFSKLSCIIDNQSNYSEIDVSECLYLRGQLCKQKGNEADAINDFELAAQKGHEKARQEVSRKKRIQQHSSPSFSNTANAPCCYANSLTGNNLSFISTLPDGIWSLFTAEKHNSHLNAVSVSDIDEFIHNQHIDDFTLRASRIVFLFMSENEERNLNECLILLDILFNVILEASTSQKEHLIDCIDIFVEAQYEIASMLIDANINDMGNDIYFKVHIMDKKRDAVHQLLCNAPLFIPYLYKARHEDSANIVLFGCTETNYQFIKESIACAYLGESYPVNITMIGKHADLMNKRFKQECPGIYHSPNIKCIRPAFIPRTIEEVDFPEYIYGGIRDGNQDDVLVRALKYGNYFVIDLSDDNSSIRFGMELRTWLLRSTGTYDRTPFIAVKCTNSQNSYLVSHLTLSGQAAGNTYYSRYDLFPFGIEKEMYSYSRLIEKPRLQEIALSIHKSYYGEDERQAENDYYSFSYNADSSLSTAIAINYRFFASGISFPDKEHYLDSYIFDAEEYLDQYEETIKSKSDSAAALEQSRWNGFMLSRGWESADSAQVSAYKHQSTGSSHKHTLAKLHPIIREWEDLDSDDFKTILGTLQSKFDYNKHPKSTTLKNIQDLTIILRKSLHHD